MLEEVKRGYGMQGMGVGRGTDPLRHFRCQFKYGTCYDAATHLSMSASSITCSASSMHDTDDLSKCTNPSHSACPRPCTLQELFQQGDRERALGQPISPLMDRTKAGIQKSQTGFFAVVALPMYTVGGAPLPLCPGGALRARVHVHGEAGPVGLCVFVSLWRLDALMSP